MNQGRYSSEGIILNRRSFGEADRIINIFTRKYGKLSFIAKGVRRPSSKKRGHLEVFNNISFQASSGKGMDILTEAQVIDNFSEIRSDLTKVAVAYYLLEVVNRTTRDGEPHEEVYELLLKYLHKLGTSNHLKKLRTEFASFLLTLLGYWPRGKNLDNPDLKVQEIIERRLGTLRVGKKLLT